MVEQIVEKYGTEVQSAVERRNVRCSLEGKLFRLTERHFLIMIQTIEKKNNRAKRCIVFHKNSQRNKVTIYANIAVNHFVLFLLLSDTIPFIIWFI